MILKLFSKSNSIKLMDNFVCKLHVSPSLNLRYNMNNDHEHAHPKRTFESYVLNHDTSL